MTYLAPVQGLLPNVWKIKIHHHTSFWKEHFIAKHILELKCKREMKEKRKKKKQ